MNILRNFQRFFITALAVVALATAPTTAQEVSPEHLALARKYVELTDVAQVFEVAVVTTSFDVLGILTQQNPAIADELSIGVGDTVKEYKGRKGELLDQFARVYASRFTIEDLKQIVAFYESDVGQKLVKQNFEANQQIQAIMKIFRANLNTEFLAKVRATMKERGFDV